MSASSEQSKRGLDFNDKSAITSKIKVSSYTQVESQFVGGDFRSIVGQEDCDENIVTKRLHDLSLQKQNKGVRPPLVGQASSSSNDSVSLSFERRLSDSESNEASPPHQTEPFSDLNVDADDISYGRGNHYMLNRDDYINQKPPEGSSDQIIAITQPPENVHDFNRLQSPSSASSVTSGPPLQWDSLADVGYQHYALGGNMLDIGMSTLERMALVHGTNLLTRSDPEGTTGPSRQPQSNAIKSSLQARFKPKNKLGYPKAESTPMGTSATSDMSPETVSEDQISPINYDSVGKLAAGATISSSSSKGDNEKSKPLSGVDNNQSPLSQSTQRSPRAKVPLFPEIINSLPSKSQQKTLIEVDTVEKNPNAYLEQSKAGETSLHNESVGLLVDTPIVLEDEIKRPKFTSDLKSKLKCLEKNSNSTSLTKSKKLSSSLENISTFNNDAADDKSSSNTLPRSQSQLSFHTDSLDNKNTNMTNGPKYSMALHSLGQYNKSASSSSIATVVHRKGDSPKHVFAQTSAFKNESVAVQVGGDNKVGFSSKIPSKMVFDETPHLPKSAPVPQLFVKRSNYFNYNTPENRLEPGKMVTSLTECSKSSEKSPTKVSAHCHDGVLCTGAHKKTQLCNQISLKQNKKSSKENQQKSNTNNDINGSFILNNDINSNQYVGHVSYYRNEDDKSHFGAGTIDSVESSAKSGGCWTDKQYSMTVEDRVNSFEYLPGHVYENTERHQPIIVDSLGTSSISIQNQTSNNDTPDDRGKLWDDSGSVSSNLDKDVQRGVELFSDFVKGSCANDSVLKKKLIEKVVERLITKNYSNDKVGPTDLASNVPWVPSRPPNPVPVERNGRETRRSVNRSKVPCEFSSRSEKSGSANASSDCFIPCPAANSTVLPSSLRDSSCMPGKNNNHSSTSEISVEKFSKNHSKPPHPLDVTAHIVPNGSISKDLTDISSSKRSHRGNWKEALTKSEKLLEEKKTSKCREESGSQSDEVSLVHFLNMERENQLFWIRSEIQHLSNLKELLEKQENLKQCVKDMKLRQKAGKNNILREGNVDRINKDQIESKSSLSGGPRKTSMKSQSKYQPTLSSWLEQTVREDSKVNTTVSSVMSSDIGMEDWTSHHYRDENDENIRSCLKRKSKNRSQKGDKYRVSSDERTSRALYDEPPSTPRQQVKENKHSKLPSTPYPKQTNQVDDPFFVTERGVSKKNAQTETLNTVGVQTTNSVQQLPVVHPNWYRQADREVTDRCTHACACVSGCRCNCCGDRASIRKGEKTKAAVGYYVTFEPSPREQEKPVGARPLEEVRIPVPVSEPKSKPSRRPPPRPECRERETPSQGVESRRTGSENPEPNCRRTETDSGSSESENSERLRERPIYNGCVGTLQYYLLRNHPSYVSRAEDRRQCIAQMQYLRELREQSKRRLLTLTEPQQAVQMPPPPLAYRRVFSQQTMRRQTEKKYKQLAEVKGKQQDTKRKEGYRTNRLMAEIFNKKLQRRVLKGEVNLSNSVSVISSL